MTDHTQAITTLEHTTARLEKHLADNTAAVSNILQTLEVMLLTSTSISESNKGLKSQVATLTERMNGGNNMDTHLTQDLTRLAKRVGSLENDKEATRLSSGETSCALQRLIERVDNLSDSVNYGIEARSNMTRDTSQLSARVAELEKLPTLVTTVEHRLDFQRGVLLAERTRGAEDTRGILALTARVAELEKLNAPPERTQDDAKLGELWNDVLKPLLDTILPDTPPTAPALQRAVWVRQSDGGVTVHETRQGALECETPYHDRNPRVFSVALKD